MTKMPFFLPPLTAPEIVGVLALNWQVPDSTKTTSPLGFTPEQSWYQVPLALAIWRSDSIMDGSRAVVPMLGSPLDTEAGLVSCWPTQSAQPVPEEQRTVPCTPLPSTTVLLPPLLLVPNEPATTGPCGKVG